MPTTPYKPIICCHNGLMPQTEIKSSGDGSQLDIHTHHYTIRLMLRKTSKKGLCPTHPSAATACQIHKEEQKAHSLRFYHHSNLGKHFPNLGPASNKTTLRFIDNSHNNSHILARLAWLLTGHAPIGRYYSTKPYFQWDTKCTCNGKTLQSRNHILDHCPLYIHHWESWQHIQKIKEHPLQELVEFLITNPLAFTFEHAPAMLHTDEVHWCQKHSFI